MPTRGMTLLCIERISLGDFNTHAHKGHDITHTQIINSAAWTYCAKYTKTLKFFFYNSIKYACEQTKRLKTIIIFQFAECIKKTGF